MKKYKIVALFLVITITSLLSGCWDNIEINKRAFALGIALDKGDPPNDLNVTYEIALPSKISSTGGGSDIGGGSGGGGKATWNITKTSSRILQTSLDIQENIDRVLDLQHMQLLIIGGEEARKGILNDVDFFFRRPQMRRRTNIVYVEGKATDLLNVIPKTTKSPSMFISDILNSNVYFTDTISKPVDLGELVQNIRDGFDFSIVRVSIIDKQAVIDGAAAFKDGKFVSSINEGEIKALDWVSGNIDRGKVEVDDPESPTQKLVYEVHDGTSKLKPEFAGNQVNFKLEVNVEGDIGELENTNFMGTLELPYIKAAEQAIREKMKSEVEDVYNKYEREKKVDVLQLKRKIKNYNIEFYDKNKDRLDDILAQSNIDISVTAKIRRVGLTK